MRWDDNLSRSSGALGILFLLLLNFQVSRTHALWEWFGIGRRETEGSGYSTNSHEGEPVLGTSARTGPLKLGFEFDIDTTVVLGANSRGKELFENSASVLSGNSCWQVAYSGMSTSCRDILKDENKKSRLALRMTDCFLKTSGRGGIKSCVDGGPIYSCVKSLDDHTHSIFLAFYIDAASMCHYLQSQEFKFETEKLVNDLKQSAHDTETKLISINDQLDVQHADVIEQSETILEAQRRLQSEHAVLQASIEQGMLNLQEAADEAQRQLEAVNKIQKNIAQKQQLLAENLALELSELQRKSNLLGSSMGHLEVSVDDLTEKSLAGQAHLLAAQEEAMVGLTELQRSQVEAIQESRTSIQDLAAEAYKHQEEFRSWQTELNEMHRRLVNGSTTILKAQESFVTKQAAVFTTLEKLFSLHNAILVESRAFKTVLVYFAMAVLVFMATTTKHTQNARLLLYFGLFVTFTYEMWLIRFRPKELNVEAVRFVWPPQKLLWVRGTYGALALAYLFYSVLTFRDYEMLNYNMLKELHGSIAGRTRLQEQLVEEYLANCNHCNTPPSAFSRAKADHERDITKKVSQRARPGRPPRNTRSASSTRSSYTTS